MLSVRFVSIAVAGVLVVAATASAQGLGSLRKKAEEAKKKVETAVDRKPTVDSAKAKPGPPAVTAPSTSSTQTAAPAVASAPGNAVAPSAKVWENYDFV